MAVFKKKKKRRASFSFFKGKGKWASPRLLIIDVKGNTLNPVERQDLRVSPFPCVSYSLVINIALATSVPSSVGCLGFFHKIWVTVAEAGHNYLTWV